MGRKLRPEEQELWQKVTERTNRMRPESVTPQPQVPPNKPASKSVKPIAQFKVGQTAKTDMFHNLSSTISETLATAPVHMDRKKFTNLKRGKMAPEGRIDLHGLTLAQAHPRLTSFIMKSYAQDRRLVLVITGKGKDRDDGGPIPVRKGVLKHQVPHWLHTPPLRQMVLQVSEAHGKHGGAGAYYVYLKRNR